MIMALPVLLGKHPMIMAVPQGNGHMRAKGWVLLCFLPAASAGLCAQAITGTILIKTRLTQPSVTAPVSVYQRGTVVDLGKDAEQNPITYERSRVVVYLEGPAPSGKSSSVPPAVQPTVQIEQLNRRFVPNMVVVPVGSTVSFPNMDPIFHNIYSLSKPRSFDLCAYDKGQTRKVTFPRPGIVEIYCHLHPNMQATVVVTPSRWYAQPDRDGRYRIAGVPPGEYTVVAWHKTAGFFRQKVAVKGDRDSTVDFFIPLDVDPGQAAEQSHQRGKAGGSL
jgi:plastocyanin